MIGMARSSLSLSIYSNKSEHQAWDLWFRLNGEELGHRTSYPRSLSWLVPCPDQFPIWFDSPTQLDICTLLRFPSITLYLILLPVVVVHCFRGCNRCRRLVHVITLLLLIEGAGGLLRVSSNILPPEFDITDRSCRTSRKITVLVHYVINTGTISSLCAFAILVTVSILADLCSTDTLCTHYHSTL